jgi:hypothetical protein
MTSFTKKNSLLFSKVKSFYITHLLFLNYLKIDNFFSMLIQNNIGSNKFKLVDKKCTNFFIIIKLTNE